MDTGIPPVVEEEAGLIEDEPVLEPETRTMLAKFDLTTAMAPFLDRHLILPLLEFITGRGVYCTSQLLKSTLELLLPTKMIDFRIETYHKLYPEEEVPNDLLEEREQTVARVKDEVLIEQEAIASMFADDKIKSIRDSRQLFEYLEKEHNFGADRLENLYELAEFAFNCGMYLQASQLLHSYRTLSPANNKSISVMWGKLATEILNQNWDVALDELNKLKDAIDTNTFRSSLQMLQERTWFIHWALFVYFNHEKGKDLILDQFLYEPQYLNAVQTMCPHILRYLATAVVTNKRRRNVMKDLVKIIQQELYAYRDPITEFIECLFVHFDFAGAQKKLVECDKVVSNDFFIVAYRDEFMENARLLIFETFCRIHQCIGIDMLAEKLNLELDAAEKWIVQLIRDSHLDAKIDSQLGHVVMGSQTPSPYQEVIEKTKALSFRSQVLVSSIVKVVEKNTVATTAGLEPIPVTSPWAQ